ncbi:MAG TPA: anthranilate phosphoribosyltransferase [Pyrinomonadaceae bacterium]|nr:anthranilate phosphoribosyltransferase [Pyrinomonadaceae bacterium]
MRDEVVSKAVGSDEQLSFRSLLLRVLRGEDLNRAEARLLLDSLLGEEVTDAQIGAALAALAAKGETVEELVGMAEVMRERATRIRARHATFVDTAGTGSSSVKTFNVSTAAAFVTASAGLPVAKHGSRAVTSRTGSADVLTALGVGTSVPAEVSEKCLNELGICFMFAPLYHSATARVAGVRRELGIHTVFNLLGPLTNPARAPRQVMGVWRAELVEPLARALSMLGAERAWVVHGSDGLDEVTTSGKTRVAEAAEGRVTLFDIEPEDFGLRRSALEGVRVSDADQSASVVRSILSGERRDEARDLVLANAAAALFVGGAAGNLKDAARLAREKLESGAARAKLEEFVKATNE